MSGGRSPNAVRWPLSPLQPGEPPLSRPVQIAATLHRRRLGDRPGARSTGGSTALPARRRHGKPPWKGTLRRTETLLRRSRNGPLKTRSCSASQWTVRRLLLWCSSPRTRVKFMEEGAMGRRIETPFPPPRSTTRRDRGARRPRRPRTHRHTRSALQLQGRRDTRQRTTRRSDS